MDEDKYTSEMTFEQDREAFLKELEKSRFTKKHLIVTIIAVLFFTGIAVGEYRLIKKELRGNQEQASSRNRELTADDDVVKQYLVYEDGFFHDDAKALLGMTYSEICKLFEHEENESDLSSESDGFAIYVEYDEEVIVDFHFRNKKLYRVALYSGLETYDAASAAAEQAYGSMFEYVEEKEKQAYHVEGTYDFWLWKTEDSTHQQYIDEDDDQIGYYIKDNFLSEDCLELIGKPYIEVCNRFGFETSEDDFTSDGEAKFTYSVFDYEDDLKDCKVYFRFRDNKLYHIAYYISGELEMDIGGVVEQAKGALGEPSGTVGDEWFYFDEVGYNCKYILRESSMGDIEQTYEIKEEEAE